MFQEGPPTRKGPRSCAVICTGALLCLLLLLTIGLGVGLGVPLGLLKNSSPTSPTPASPTGEVLLLSTSCLSQCFPPTSAELEAAGLPAGTEARCVACTDATRARNGRQRGGFKLEIFLPAGSACGPACIASIGALLTNEPGCLIIAILTALQPLQAANPDSPIVLFLGTGQALITPVPSCDFPIGSVCQATFGERIITYNSTAPLPYSLGCSPTCSPGFYPNVSLVICSFAGTLSSGFQCRPKTCKLPTGFSSSNAACGSAGAGCGITDVLAATPYTCAGVVTGTPTDCTVNGGVFEGLTCTPACTLPAGITSTTCNGAGCTNTQLNSGTSTCAGGTVVGCGSCPVNGSPFTSLTCSPKVCKLPVAFSSSNPACGSAGAGCGITDLQGATPYTCAGVVSGAPTDCTVSGGVFEGLTCTPQCTLPAGILSTTCTMGTCTAGVLNSGVTSCAGVISGCGTCPGNGQAFTGVTCNLLCFVPAGFSSTVLACNAGGAGCTAAQVQGTVSCGGPAVTETAVTCPSAGGAFTGFTCAACVDTATENSGCQLGTSDVCISGVCVCSFAPQYSTGIDPAGTPAAHSTTTVASAVLCFTSCVRDATCTAWSWIATTLSTDFQKCYLFTDTPSPPKLIASVTATSGRVPARSGAGIVSIPNCQFPNLCSNPAVVAACVPVPITKCKLLPPFSSTVEACNVGGSGVGCTVADLALGTTVCGMVIQARGNPTCTALADGSIPFFAGLECIGGSPFVPAVQCLNNNGNPPPDNQLGGNQGCGLGMANLCVTITGFNGGAPTCVCGYAEQAGKKVQGGSQVTTINTWPGQPGKAITPKVCAAWCATIPTCVAWQFTVGGALPPTGTDYDCKGFSRSGVTIITGTASDISGWLPLTGTATSATNTIATRGACGLPEVCYKGPVPVDAVQGFAGFNTPPTCQNVYNLFFG